MKLRYLIFIINCALSLHAMEAPEQELEKPGGKRPAQESLLAEQPEQKKIKSEKEAKAELSEKKKMDIAWLREMAKKGMFSDEVGAEILKQLATVKVRGGTQEQKLYNAIANIRDFMDAFPKFYVDKKINGDLIHELANRYAYGEVIKVAIALATTGAGQWLKEFVGDIQKRKLETGIFLTEATRLHQFGIVRFILKYLPELVNIYSLNGSTPLMFAAENGNLQILEFLLQIPQIDVNIKNMNGRTALMFAALADRIEIVQRLLQVPGINLNAQNNEGQTVLMIVAVNGNLQILELLLQKPEIINVNLQDSKGSSALMYAVTFGHLLLVERLLQVPGINVNLQNQGGNTALTIAIDKRNLTIVDLLLQMPEINVNLQNPKGVTPLMRAVAAGYIAIVQRLLQVFTIDVNARERNNITALKMTEIFNIPNKDEIIKLLKDHGATE